jgi:uncharacterized protein (DUF1778 family)
MICTSAVAERLEGSADRIPTSFSLDKVKLYCHCKYMKEERLQIRIDSESKRRLEAAAVASRLSVSAFVVQAAESRAEELMVDRQLIELPQSAAIAFSEALQRPAKVNERLAAALGRPLKFSWID